MIVVVDNRDSFVHTLARYARELGHETSVVRCDAVSVADVAALSPSHSVLSPGPCTPDEAGVSVDLVRELGPAVPVLGVCLGHQCVGRAYGAAIARARRPMHGRASPIAHDGDGVELVRQLRPDDVVLVADAGLGTINAVLLSVGPYAALGHDPLVVLNRFDGDDDLHRRNLAWLRDRVGLRVFTDVDDVATALGPARPSVEAGDVLG